MTLSINSCLNIGNILRTSNLTGVDKFFIFGKRKYEKKSAVRAHKYSNVIRISDDIPFGIEEKNNSELIDSLTKIKLDTQDYIFDTNIFIAVMKKYNMIPIFIEQSNNSIKLSDINWNYINSKIIPKYTFCFIFW